LDAVGSGSVGDKFGDRSWESNALAGGEPRLVDPLRGGGDHRFLATINVGSFGVPEAAMRFVNILSAARAARLLPSGSGWLHARRQVSTAALSSKSG
jgi:hypothetical protein